MTRTMFVSIAGSLLMVACNLDNAPGGDCGNEHEIGHVACQCVVPLSGDYSTYSKKSQSAENASRIDVSFCGDSGKNYSKTLEPNEVYTCINYECGKTACPDGFVRDPNDKNKLKCIQKSLCKSNELYDEIAAKCVCDSENHWKGEAGQCECESGYEPDGDSCVEHDPRCPAKHKHDGTNCVCDSSKHWVGTPGDCKCDSGYVKINDACEESKENKCDSTTQKYKAETNECICNDSGYVDVGGECQKKKNCDDVSENWEASTNTCVCKDDYIKLVNKCEKKSVCNEETEQWIEETNKCECKDDYVLIGDMCAPVENCSSNAVYDERNKTCVCKNGSIALLGYCVKVGDTVPLGTYYYHSGRMYIDWLVLSIETKRVLLISKYVLDAKPYHEKNTDITWAQSTIRSWLNGYSSIQNLEKIDYKDENFMKIAFNEDEMKRILTVDIKTGGNPVSGVPGGDDTRDSIFFLSVEEAETYFRSISRIAYATGTAAENGVFVDDKKCVAGWPSDNYCASIWWLRTPGEDPVHVSFVLESGAINSDPGDEDDVENIGIRPAMWISR